jgi:hypothetical protein
MDDGITAGAVNREIKKYLRLFEIFTAKQNDFCSA